MAKSKQGKSEVITEEPIAKEEVLVTKEDALKKFEYKPQSSLPQPSVKITGVWQDLGNGMKLLNH